MWYEHLVRGADILCRCRCSVVHVVSCCWVHRYEHGSRGCAAASSVCRVPVQPTLLSSFPRLCLKCIERYLIGWRNGCVSRHSNLCACDVCCLHSPSHTICFAPLSIVTALVTKMHCIWQSCNLHHTSVDNAERLESL